MAERKLKIRRGAMNEATSAPLSLAPPILQRCLIHPALATAVVIVVVLLAYSNSLSGTFVYDDINNIVENQEIRQLWPSRYLSKPGTRSLGFYSFAVNYSLHGYDVWGYHATNLAIHLSAALFLFGIARRTLRHGAMGERFGDAADGLALVVALIWAVHPLQTQSVTYIVQRLESLMGMLYLAMLYCFIRGVDSDRKWPWYVASLLCFAFGSGVKEVIATAPMVILWYDRAFIARTWRELIRSRWAYYSAFVVAGLPIGVYAVRMALSPAPNAAAGIGSKAPPVWEYLRTQPEVILHYIRLAIWPSGQSLEYSWPIAQSPGGYLAQGAVIVSLLGLTVWAIFKYPRWSFLGGWFFLILAPTSSFIPVLDTAYEHRMYLPLAAIIAGAVIGAHAWVESAWRERPASWRRGCAAALACVVIASLAVVTYQRNFVYQSRIAMWEDVVAKVPSNARGHLNLSKAYLAERQWKPALDHALCALDLNPSMAVAHNNAGLALAKLGMPGEAVTRYRLALRCDPNLAHAWLNLGNLAATTSREKGKEFFEKALQCDINNAEAHNSLGMMLLLDDETREAANHFRTAITIKPGYALAHYNLSDALARQGLISEAAGQFQIARSLNPQWYNPPESLRRLIAGDSHVE